MSDPTLAARYASGRVARGGLRSAGLAGLSVGLLAGVPLLRSLTGIGTVAYAIPLGAFLCATLLRGAVSGRITATPVVLFYVLLTTSFVTWMGASALWALPDLDVMDDVVVLGALLVFAGLAASALDEEAVEAGIYAVLAAALLGAAYVFGSYIAAGSLRGYGALQGQYLPVAQLVGLGTVLAVLRAVTTIELERRLNTVAALFLLGGLALSLARGALLSALLLSLAGAVYASWLQGSERRSFQAWLRHSAARLALASSVVGAIGLAIGSALSVERTRLRLLRLFSGGELSQGGRGQMWGTAWDNIARAPFFGHGLGTSGVMSGRTEDLYPHNWALQVWLDGGVVGLLLTLALIALPLIAVLPALRRGSRSASPASRWLPVCGAYSFLVLEYTKSFNFYTARMLLVLGVLLLYAARAPRPAR